MDVYRKQAVALDQVFENILHCVNNSGLFGMCIEARAVHELRQYLSLLRCTVEFVCMKLILLLKLFG